MKTIFESKGKAKIPCFEWVIDVESKSVKMPKTVEELVSERKNTGNIVYEESIELSAALGEQQSRTFAIKNPVPAIW